MASIVLSLCVMGAVALLISVTTRDPPEEKCDPADCKTCPFPPCEGIDACQATERTAAESPETPDPQPEKSQIIFKKIAKTP